VPPGNSDIQIISSLLTWLGNSEEAGTMAGMDNTQLWKVDFHSHTSFSKDSLTRPEKLVAAARAAGLDRIVVTDHNEIKGALRARELAPELVIVGEEVMTTEGELLAAYVSERVPAGLKPEDAIARLREQGAFISVSHPFDHVRHGAWHLAELRRIAPLVDAIEIFNARCAGAKPNRQAVDFAREFHLPGTAGSDAHAPFELGRGAVWLPPFDSAASLKQALAAGHAEGRLSPYWVHLTSRAAVWAKRLKLA